MTAPVRIQRSRRNGWRMPPGAVYVGRPTIWGNPFIHDDPAQAVAAFEQLATAGAYSFEMGPGKLRFAANAHPNTTHWAYAEFVRKHISQLRGLDLACYCAPGAPCHGDVLLRLANPTEAL